MDREQKRLALRRRLRIAAIAAVIISFLFFHPMENLILSLDRLTLGSAWYDLVHRHFWGLFGDSMVILCVIATLITVHYGKMFWRDNCRLMARSISVVWRWNLRPATRRFAVAAFASIFLFVSMPRLISWAYGNQLRTMSPPIYAQFTHVQKQSILGVAVRTERVGRPLFPQIHRAIAHAQRRAPAPVAQIAQAIDRARITQGNENIRQLINDAIARGQRAHRAITPRPKAR